MMSYGLLGIVSPISVDPDSPYYNELRSIYDTIATAQDGLNPTSSVYVQLQTLKLEVLRSYPYGAAYYNDLRAWQQRATTLAAQAATVSSVPAAPVAAPAPAVTLVQTPPRTYWGSWLTKTPPVVTQQVLVPPTIPPPVQTVVTAPLPPIAAPAANTLTTATSTALETTPTVETAQPGASIVTSSSQDVVLTTTDTSRSMAATVVKEVNLAKQEAINSALWAGNEGDIPALSQAYDNAASGIIAEGTAPVAAVEGEKKSKTWLWLLILGGGALAWHYWPKNKKNKKKGAT